ncbi:MAG: hypothetical protein JWP26_3013 [Devosia sp.]|uniref:DUF1993 domain-containing protein n=1 Tax=Devosia sp. TaxID=1871048 RepID=UPI0026080971|nr:DUF1993 domain-containing protein [Devosia sp.]MDB5588043.1 hypothetical protein [Devosia sp.]
MTISMYGASVPVYTRMLTNLLTWLDKAEAYAAERKIDLAVLVNDRLAPDMLPFKSQVQIATDHVKGSLSRLAGKPVPSWDDNEVTFEDLRARVRKALDVCAASTAAEIDGSEDKPITLKNRAGEYVELGQAYLLHRAMPNFYFHITTAYAILRHNGVPIGKTDFIG